MPNVIFDANLNDLAYICFFNMFCLSRFCCLCFCTKTKLNSLYETKHDETPFLALINEIIPEMEFRGMGRGLLICDDCRRCVEGMYLFRRNCIRNNLLFGSYVGQLRSFGGLFGELQVRVVDFREVPEPFDVKTEAEELFGVGDCDYIVMAQPPEHVLKDDKTDLCNVNVHAEATNEMVFESFDSINQIIENNDPDFAENRDFNDVKERADIIAISDEDCQELDEYREEADKTMDESGADSIVSLQNEEGPERLASLYSCDVCNKTFTTLTAQRRHQLNHSIENYKCELCPKSFAASFLLKYHRMMHSLEKPHKCDFCARSYWKLHSLNDHRISQHSTGTLEEDRVFKCDECCESFSYFARLESHYIKEHAGKRGVVSCQVCKESFDSQESLDRHGMRHIGMRYKCEICGEGFKFLYKLSLHKMVHNWKQTIADKLKE